LVESNGTTAVAPGAGTFVQIGTANTALTTAADVILDSISPTYTSAAALQSALETLGVGNFKLAGAGAVAAGNTVDMLIAYNTGASINIADLTIHAGTTAVNNTAAGVAGGIENGATLAVHDLVHLTSTVGLANFTAQNIHFV
jgi:hypothetical protein